MDSKKYDERHKHKKVKVKHIPALAGTRLDGRPANKIVAASNHDASYKYNRAEKQRAYEIYVRTGGRVSKVSERTGVNHITLRRWRKKYNWADRMSRLLDKAQEMGDNALARELSVTTRQEIDRMDILEQEVLELMKKPSMMIGVDYAKLANLMLKISERRLSLRRVPAPAKQADSQQTLKPGEVEDTQRIKVVMEEKLRRIKKLAAEEGISVESLRGAKSENAEIVIEDDKSDE